MTFPASVGCGMAFMRMPGQTWLDGATSFLGMWVVMMVVMMLPSLIPMLRRYHDAVRDAARWQLGLLMSLVTVAYFVVWALFGMVAYPVGAGLTAITMQQPALTRVTPIAIGATVVLASALQFSAWKARHLECCRESPGRGVRLPADARTAVRHGLRVGLHCACSCAGLTTILLVIGVMDLRAMAVVTAAITAERLAPGGGRVARIIGTAGVAAGVVLIAWFSLR